MRNLIILAFAIFVTTSGAKAQVDSMRSVSYGLNKQAVEVLAVKTPRGISIEINQERRFYRYHRLIKEIPEKISAIQRSDGRWVPAGVTVYKNKHNNRWSACYYSLERKTVLGRDPFIFFGINVTYEQQAKGFPFK